MSKRRNKTRAIQEPPVPPRKSVDWRALKPFNSVEARKWSEKHAGQLIYVDNRTFRMGGAYIEKGRLFFWVDPCDSEVSYFRIDSKIARLMKHGFWEEL